VKLAVSLGLTEKPVPQARLVAELEQAGVDIVWVPEAYTVDSPTTMGYLAAHTKRVQIGSSILSLYSRSPAVLAQTAAGLDAVSGGRAILGIGSSGPQVVEGLHGVPFERPVARTRDVIEVCRLLWSGAPSSYSGEVVTLPLPAAEGTGLGKPMKLKGPLVRDRIPIYVGGTGPATVEQTAALADGWLSILFHPERASQAWSEPLRIGTSRRSPELPPLDIVAGGPLAIVDETTAEALREQQRGTVALFVGGMGARGRNFYNDLFCRYGWKTEASAIQNLFLDGKRREAAAAVPDEYLMATSLVGEEGRVRERVEAYEAAGVTCLNVELVGPDPVRSVSRLRELIG
jgi:F420-dependent oxidoreductase-like protein